VEITNDLQKDTELMTKVRHIVFATACLAAGLSQSAGAQTLQANAIALTVGDFLTLKGLEISVTSVSCTDGGGACPDLFLAPTSGPGATVTIEAATGNIAGTSTLQPIFSYTCATAGSCSGTYDLTVGLDVQEIGSGHLTGVAGSIAGSANPSSDDTFVHLGETVMDANTFNPLCNESGVNPGSPSFSCSFASTPSTFISIDKDIGMSVGSLPTGGKLMLTSVTQSFTPAPEPASLATLLAGVFALGAVRRSRRRA
jgi:hypothetical protein